MTATNHALAGALIAMAVKKPELALPLAFLSHFALDALPHYNPPNLTKNTFRNYQDAWSKKLRLRGFRIIFASDMILFVSVLVAVPWLSPAGVSPLTVFFSALAGASPDFDGGLRFLLRRLGVMHSKSKENDWFSRFHIIVQWMERPWGIYVEGAFLVALILAIGEFII